MDVYKIGVSIALANGVSAILAVIQKDVMGLNKAVNMTNASLTRMKVAVGGAFAIGVGTAMLTGLMKLEKAGERWTEQLTLMKAAGMDFAEQQEAIAAAYRVSSEVPSTTPSGNLLTIRELIPALNSAGASPQEATAEAIKYLALVEKAQAVMQTTAGGRAMSANGGIYEMIKGLEEIKATLNPERFEKLLGGMVQASEAFGGKVNARDWFQTLKYTRGAGQFYDDDFIMHYLPTLIQEMKSGTGTGAGGGPGNALASLFQAVVGNTFSIKTRDLGIKLGLIDPSKSTLDRHGRIHNQPGAWYGADLAALNPAKFAQQFLIQTLSKQMGGHMLDIGPNGQYLHVKEVATTLATLFGNRTAQQMVGLLLNVQKMEGDKKLVERATPLSQSYDDLSRTNPKLVRDEFAHQLERISEDLGKAISPAFTEFLFQLTQGLRKLAELIEAHPVVTKWVLALIAGLAGLLVVLGTLAVGAAAIAALGGLGVAAAIAGILGVAGAIAWLATGSHWQEMRGWMARQWSRLGAVIKQGWAGLVTIAEAAARRLWAGMQADLARIANVMTALFKAVVDGLSSGWDRVSAFIKERLAAAQKAVVDGIGNGWDRVTALLTERLSAIRTAVVSGVTGIFSTVTQSALDGVGRISTALVHWANTLPDIAAQVARGLAEIGARIIGWVASLPGQIAKSAAEGLGFKPTAPGAENHPNGVPTPGPMFGPQHMPHPSDAPRKYGYLAPREGGQQHITLVAYNIVDGEVVSKSVTKRLIRAGQAPSTGTTGPDVRMGTFGGMAGAFA